MLIGDSVTQGWMESGADFDQTAYVRALARRGINLLMLWTYKGTTAAAQEKDARLGYDAPELWPWQGSTDQRTMDLFRLNDAYFTRLRALTQEAESAGIVVLITVHDGWAKTAFSGHPFNRDLGNGPLDDRHQYVELADYEHEMGEEPNPDWTRRERNQFFQERFCSRLIAELAGLPNVMYEMFNEGEWYDADLRRRHEEHFLRFFRARCRNVLLSNTDHIRGDEPHTDGLADVVSLHSMGWTGHFTKFQAGFQQTPPKPYLCSEPVPEFDGESPSMAQLRCSMWEAALAGAGWVNQNDASFGWNPRAAIASRSAARDEAYDAAGHCARFLNSGDVHFWDMAPHGELSDTGVCLARPGHEYLIYTPTGGPVRVDLSATGAARLQVRWHNPTSGELQTGEPVLGGAWASLEPPFSGDAVLHLVHGD